MVFVKSQRKSCKISVYAADVLKDSLSIECLGMQYILMELKNIEMYPTKMVINKRVICVCLLCCRRREKEREGMRVERKAMRAAEENKIVQTLLNLDPYMKFQKLQAPTLDVSVTTDQLFEMMKTVPSRRVHTYTSFNTCFFTSGSRGEITSLGVPLGCAIIIILELSYLQNWPLPVAI